MNGKTMYLLKNCWQLCKSTWLVVVLCLIGCSDDNDNGGSGAAFDPNAPVEINALNPTSGSFGQRLVIKGRNFGNDPSLVNVYIGGKKAHVINAKNEMIYCLVPSRAYSEEPGPDGNVMSSVEVQIVKDGEVLAKGMNENVKFQFQLKILVGTLCGQLKDDGRYDTKDGPFDDCGAFGSPNWMEFDPKYPNLLYVAADMAGDENQGNGNMRVLDLENEYVGTALTEGTIGSNRGRCVAFFDDDHMLVAVDQGDELRAAVYGFTRTKNPPKGEGHDYQIWGNRVSIVNYKQCNTVAVHPVDGDMYFNSFQKGQFYRVDRQQVQDIFDGTRTEPADKEELFLMDNDWEYNIRIHPTGNYAYIVSPKHHYIQRTNYNWASHRFTTPYVVAGTAQRSGWEDAVGTMARFNTPYQGVFVYNPLYEGQEDEYDFYVCDKMNHCIRIITPTGQVTTFAGRGSSSLNNNPWGYVDGDVRKEARFDRCKGLAYDEESGTFFVGDGSNRRIRIISEGGLYEGGKTDGEEEGE